MVFHGYDLDPMFAAADANDGDLTKEFYEAHGGDDAPTLKQCRRRYRARRSNADAPDAEPEEPEEPATATSKKAEKKACLAPQEKRDSSSLYLTRLARLARLDSTRLGSNPVGDRSEPARHRCGPQALADACAPGDQLIPWKLVAPCTSSATSTDRCASRSLAHPSQSPRRRARMRP
jgi:hypothetical protein